MKLKFRTFIFLLLILFCIAVFWVYQRQADLGANTSLSQCVPITEGLSSSNLSGWMVYESRQDGEDSFAVDLQTDTKLPFDHLTAYTLIGPSKAGRIVYDDYNLNNWASIGIADDVKTISVVNVDNATPIDWAGERLVLGTDRLQLLDMENGDIESMISDADFSKISNAIDWQSKLNWGGYSPYHIVPSPDLTYLALAASGEPAPSLVLWDLKNARVSAQLLWADTLSSPKWSPDGAGVISSAPPYIFYDMKQYVNIQDNLPYVGGSDVMYLGVDGRVRRLTTFSSVVKAYENRYVVVTGWQPYCCDGGFYRERSGCPSPGCDSVCFRTGNNLLPAWQKRRGGWLSCLVPRQPGSSPDSERGRRTPTDLYCGCEDRLCSQNREWNANRRLVAAAVMGNRVIFLAYDFRPAAIRLWYYGIAQMAWVSHLSPQLERRVADPD